MSGRSEYVRIAENLYGIHKQFNHSMDVDDLNGPILSYSSALGREFSIAEYSSDLKSGTLSLKCIYEGKLDWEEEYILYQVEPIVHVLKYSVEGGGLLFTISLGSDDIITKAFSKREGLTTFDELFFDRKYDFDDVEQIFYSATKKDSCLVAEYYGGRSNIEACLMGELLSYN